MKNNKTIEKVSKLKKPPITLIGFPLLKGENVWLYPNLDPTFYYVFEKSCVLDEEKLGDGEQIPTSILLDPECQIECVSRITKAAHEIFDAEKQSNCCSCNPSRPPIAEAQPQPKEVLRQWIIDLANTLLDMGITELQCGGNTQFYRCCLELNKLLDDIRGGGDGRYAAEKVMVTCLGTAI